MLAVRVVLGVATSLLVLLPGSGKAAVCNGGLIGGLFAGTPGITANAIVFGPYYGSTGTAVTAVNTITVTCVGALLPIGPTLPAFTIALSMGNAASYGPRTMTGTTTPLSYNIYTTAALTNVWGNGTGSTLQSGGNAGASTQSFTGFGAIPAHQFVKAGSYSDMITVTVTY
ncbi:spore coat protein U domain-containing protein [Acidisoma cellulosilytica]|uniref:Spore coat protein U domain-containing protein n=1 Tax=Acidisoma cellulosilyticum TaxID=2802395 RepID=A0A963Z2C1_9PROT|nr:spore coat protein U domain-containing protein [Acidisoma cellulosilyticum]MCB8881563.1 spore coat protein U domain-containing protein [Acidisoma cellulosilyticum]